MTAGFFIATPSPAGPVAVATGLPTAGQGIAGAGAATGFEALLAAFFGNQMAGTATAQTALLSGKPGQAATLAGAGGPALGANDNADEVDKLANKAGDKTDGAKDAEAGQTISAEVQALAALMATPIASTASQTAAAADSAKSDAAGSAAAGAAFAAQKLLIPAAAKAQAAADGAADALAAKADAAAAAAAAKDQPTVGDTTAAASSPLPKLASNGPATPAPPQASKPVEAGAAPYAPPAPNKSEAASAPMPPAIEPPAPEPPAATAVGLAAAEAAATATTMTPTGAPIVKAKDLPPSHAADRLDTNHRTTADPSALDAAGASPVSHHPVAPVAPLGAKTGDALDTGEKAPVEEPKLAKTDEAGAATQPTAAAATDHATQASSTATNAARATPETVASLAAQIVRKGEARATRFDVELHPADLGRVDVRLEIGAQGRMTASMSFENPQAAAELRGRAHELQAALERAGFDVSGGLTFDVAGDRGQGGQNAASQQQQPDGGGASRGRAFQAALQSAGDTSAAAISGAFSGQGRTTSGVDIRI